MQLRRAALAPAVAFDATPASSTSLVVEGLQNFLDQVQAGVGPTAASAGTKLVEEGPAML
jgi:hypothetical protein